MGKKKATETEKKAEEFDVTSIPKPVLEKIATYAAKQGIESFNARAQEYKEQSHDNRAKNAKLLMKKYKWLKEFTHDAVSDLTQIINEEDIALLESMGMENIKTMRVESTKDRVAFTNIVLTHIDTMLGVYKDRCLSSDKGEIQRRWRVVYGLYIAEPQKTVEDIAEEEYIAERTVYKDLDIAINELSGLFFGLDFSDLYLM